MNLRNLFGPYLTIRSQDALKSGSGLKQGAEVYSVHLCLKVLKLHILKSIPSEGRKSRPATRSSINHVVFLDFIFPPNRI